MGYKLVSENPFVYECPETGKVLPIRKHKTEKAYVVIHDDNHAGFTVDCTTCEGKGLISEKCSTCSGTGVAWDKPCMACGGTGKISHPCPTCSGTCKTYNDTPRYVQSFVHIDKTVFDSPNVIKADFGINDTELMNYSKELKESKDLDDLKAITDADNEKDVVDITKPIDKQDIKAIEK